MRKPRLKFPAGMTALMTIAATALAQQPAGEDARVNGAQKPSVQQPAKPVADRPEYYTVKKGDTLKGIARRFGLDYRDLASWNGLTATQKILVGQALQLYPKVSEAGSPARVTNPTQNPPAQHRSSAAATPTPPTAPPESSSTKQPARAAPAQASAGASAALATERDQLQRLHDTTLNLIKLLVQEGVLTQDKANRLVQEAEPDSVRAGRPTAAPQQPAAAAGEEAAKAQVATAAPGTTAAGAPKSANVVRVPYVPDVVKQEIRDQVKEEVIAQAKAEHWAEPNALPEWLSRFSFDGDLRFRYQYNSYAEGNTPVLVYNAITGSNLNNTTENESKYLGRVRFGVNARISEPLMARLSITSGNALNPVSLNQNLANYNSGFSVQLTDAYLKYAPKEWAVGWLGQFPKPFVSTEMLFWDDLVFDGIAGTFSSRLGSAAKGFATLGGFLIQNASSTPQTPDPNTKALFGLQLGGKADVARNTRLNLAAAYYDFTNIYGIANPTPGSQVNDWTAPLFRQKGNSVFNINYISDPTTILYGLAPQYQVLDINGSVELAHFDPYLVKVGFDYVNNLGYNQSEILGRTGQNIDPETTGYQFLISAGKAELNKLHDWQAFFIYRYLQRDAVVDAFNDPDFYLGGTNYKGYQIGVRYGLGTNVWLRARWMSADEISGPPLGIDVLQFDLNARF